MPRDVESLRSTTIRLFGMYTGMKESTSRTFITDSQSQEEGHTQEELLLLRKAPYKKISPWDGD